jgi:acyl-CoA thioesterase-1
MGRIFHKNGQKPEFHAKNRFLAALFVIGLFWGFSIASSSSARAFVAAKPDSPAPQKVIMALGDSLVAGYGLPLAQSFPSQLAAALADKGRNVKVINAGVSGDTTADALNRLDWMLKTHPQYAIVTLGGNDMLRSLDPALTAANLDKIVEKLHARHIPVLITGMQAFTNMGYVFGDAYLKMYKDVAKKYDETYYPFFLDGVALKPEFNQDDGIHPNAAGVGIIVKNILPSVEKLLARPPAPASVPATEEPPQADSRK